MENTYKFMTPLELWADFNPVHDDLETEIIKSVTENGVIYENMYFTAVLCGEARLRVYVYSARPKKKGKFPAVLLAPRCTGKELNKKMLEPYVSDGYAVFAFDYEGAGEGKERYTLYPDELAYCNLKDAGRHMFYAEPSAKETVWYHWTRIARRTVTLMNSFDFVDDSKIVMIAEDQGCPIMWQTAAMDARLAGACSMFGYDLKYVDGETEERDCWLSGVDMRSYAAYVTMPILHIGGTNTKDGAFDALPKIAEKMNGKTDFYTDFSFGYDGLVSVRQINTMREFLNKIFVGQKFAGSPSLSVDVSEKGELTATFSCEGAKSADIWYAFGSEPEKRFWKKVDAVKKNGFYTAKIEVALPNDTLRIYGRANCGKYYLSSLGKVIVPSMLNVQCTEMKRTRLLFDSTMGRKTLLPISDERIIPEDAMDIKEGALGLKGITTSLKGLAYVRDPEQFVDFGNAESLQFEVCCEQDITVRVRIFVVSGTSCVAEKTLKGNKDWQRVQMPLSSFKGTDMKRLTTWDGIWRIEFSGISGALLNNILAV